MCADLENAYNNYMLDMSKPHGYPQAVNRWHSAGVGGGFASATNGKSIWSWASSFDSYLYRGDVGTESVAIWGSCNFSQFYVFPGIVCIPKGNMVRKMDVTPGTTIDDAVVFALISGNESKLVAHDGYAKDARVLWSRQLPPGPASARNSPAAGFPSGANGTTAWVSSFSIRQSMLYILHSNGMVSREKLAHNGIPVSPNSPPASSSGFNLSSLLAHSGNPRFNHAKLGVCSHITVDSRGTALIFCEGAHSIFAVNASDVVIGAHQSAGTDPNGPVNQKSFYGVQSMAMTVLNDKHGVPQDQLIVLEQGGPGRYMKFSLGATNRTWDRDCFACAHVDEIWNNIESGSVSPAVSDSQRSVVVHNLLSAH